MLCSIRGGCWVSLVGYCSILQNQALLLLLLPREQRGASSMLEHFADALVGLGRALEVLLGADLLAHILGL